MRVTVEVCAASLSEARAAIGFGVNSIEACSWLSCGGITPSSGLVRAMLALNPERLRVLCRPSPGGFRYGPEELRLLFSDADHFAAMKSLHGVVVGGFTASGALPVPELEALRAHPLEITFHRAIDHSDDMLLVMEECTRMGVQRILTSGGRTMAMDGAPMIKRLVDAAGGRIAIAAAGGINPGNVVEVVDRTGVGEVHFAAQKPAGRMSQGASMSSGNAGASFETEPDAMKIEGVMNALVKAGLR